MLIEALPWDTGFFGLTIGAVRPGTFDPAVFEAERGAYDLVYLFENTGDPRNALIEACCGKPADTKISYRKIAEHVSEFPEGIESFTGHEPDETLLSLALQSGTYSRFHTDPRFPAGAYERLYTEWIRRSVDRTMACDVLICREADGPVLGFVSLEIKDEAMWVGLIAVDASARGKGIGTRLLQAAERYAHQRNFLYLKVATQSANREACRLYEKCGFTAESAVHIYHYWKT